MLLSFSLFICTRFLPSLRWPSITLMNSRLNGCLSDSLWSRKDLTCNIWRKHSATKTVFCGPWLLVLGDQFGTQSVTDPQRELSWITIVTEMAVVSKYKKKCWQFMGFNEVLGLFYSILYLVSSLSHCLYFITLFIPCMTCFKVSHYLFVPDFFSVSDNNW